MDIYIIEKVVSLGLVILGMMISAIYSDMSVILAIGFMLVTFELIDIRRVLKGDGKEKEEKQNDMDSNT